MELLSKRVYNPRRFDHSTSNGLHPLQTLGKYSQTRLCSAEVQNLWSLPKPLLSDHPVYLASTRNKLWNCVFCQNKNQLPQGFIQYLNKGQFPPELQQSMTTVEYSFAEFANTDNFFIFLIDVSIELKELKAIKESLVKVFLLLNRLFKISLIMCPSVFSLSLDTSRCSS